MFKNPENQMGYLLTPLVYDIYSMMKYSNKVHKWKIVICLVSSLLQILTDVRKMFIELPSMVDISVSEVCSSKIHV